MRGGLGYLTGLAARYACGRRNVVTYLEFSDSLSCDDGRWTLVTYIDNTLMIVEDTIR